MALEKSAETYIKARLAEGAADVTELSPDEARAAERAGRDRYGKGPDMLRVDELELPVAGGSIRTRVLYPCEEPAALMVYFHGGGWVVGEIDDYDALIRTLARDAGCAVALVEYRKAPEFPYPAAVRDAIAATNWLAHNTVAAMATPAPLIVAGDSAGGNLAAVVAQASSADLVPRLTLQVLIYPVLDCDFSTPSYICGDNQLILTREAMQWYWDHYAPDPRDRLQTTASPGRSVSLQGLPPALVLTAGHDVLRSEGDDYARRLRDAGVEVIHETFEDQPHGFFSLHNVLPASETARRLIANTVRNFTAETSTAEL